MQWAFLLQFWVKFIPSFLQCAHRVGVMVLKLLILLKRSEVNIVDLYEKSIAQYTQLQ